MTASLYRENSGSNNDNGVKIGQKSKEFYMEVERKNLEYFKLSSSTESHGYNLSN